MGILALLCAVQIISSPHNIWCGCLAVSSDLLSFFGSMRLLLLLLSRPVPGLSPRLIPRALWLELSRISSSLSLSLFLLYVSDLRILQPLVLAFIVMPTSLDGIPILMPNLDSVNQTPCLWPPLRKEVKEVVVVAKGWWRKVEMVATEWWWVRVCWWWGVVVVRSVHQP